MTDTTDTPGTEAPAEELVIQQTPDGPRVVTAPLPEHIMISRDLLDSAESANVRTTASRLWLEEIGHADPEVPNDGYMLHIDAVNVTCAYRIGALPEDGPVRATLASWSEQ